MLSEVALSVIVSPTIQIRSPSSVATLLPLVVRVALVVMDAMVGHEEDQHHCICFYHQ